MLPQRRRCGVLSIDGPVGPHLDDLRRIGLGLTERGVHIVFVKGNLTFTGEGSPMPNLLLSVMGAFAQLRVSRGTQSRNMLWTAILQHLKSRISSSGV
jgi:DNA invertase Pin-like site-specific DNA recombinase